MRIVKTRETRARSNSIIHEMKTRVPKMKKKRERRKISIIEAGCRRMKGRVGGKLSTLVREMYMMERFRTLYRKKSNYKQICKCNCVCHSSIIKIIKNITLFIKIYK